MQYYYIRRLPLSIDRLPYYYYKFLRLILHLRQHQLLRPRRLQQEDTRCLRRLDHTSNRLFLCKFYQNLDPV